MQGILFVCLGNICRSPLAQGIFEHRISELGITDHFYADSAGTSAWHEGEPPHGGSIKVAKKYGIGIEKQRSRPVHLKDGEIFDYVIAMDNANFSSLTTEFRFPVNKVYLMRDFSLSEPRKKGLTVPDPWGHGPEAFEEVFAILQDAVEGLIHHLRQ